VPVLRGGRIDFHTANRVSDGARSGWGTSAASTADGFPMMVVVTLVLAHPALQFRTRLIIGVNRNVGIPMVGRSRRANANNHAFATCFLMGAPLLDLPIMATLIKGARSSEHGHR